MLNATVIRTIREHDEAAAVREAQRAEQRRRKELADRYAWLEQLTIDATIKNAWNSASKMEDDGYVPWFTIGYGAQGFGVHPFEVFWDDPNEVRLILENDDGFVLSYLFRNTVHAHSTAGFTADLTQHPNGKFWTLRIKSWGVWTPHLADLHRKTFGVRA